MENTRVVVAVAGDPGGARALAPALVCIKERGLVVVVYAYREAVPILTESGLAPIEVRGTAAAQDCADLLRQVNANCLLTATSINDERLELQFILATRQLAIPSVSLLDFWTNYRRRFEDHSGHLVLPNQIAVMDRYAATEIGEAGLDGPEVVVTGQPAFDGLTPAYRDHLLNRRSTMRRDLGVAAEDRVLLFLTQPMSLVYGEDLTTPSHPGFTEQTVLRDLLRIIGEIRRPLGGIKLIIRPHPRESVGEYDWVLDELEGVHVSADGVLHEILTAADVVMGMSSVALIEACYLKCIVLSYQPGLRTVDPLPTNRSGHSVTASSYPELSATLPGLLWDSAIRSKVAIGLDSFVPDGMAGERVCDVVVRAVASVGARERVVS